ARNAAMIFSRSLPAAAGAAAFAPEDDRADLRAGLRTMTELLCTELLGNAHARDYWFNVGPRWDGSKAASGRRWASAGKLPRSLGRGGNRFAHQLRKAVLAHQHVKRGRGRASGRRHILPQHRGIELRAVQQLT